MQVENTVSYTVNDVSFNMILVEGGTFTMGATSEQGADANDDEMPAHQVTLSSYFIGETVVTQALWQAVMGNNPSNWKGDNLPVERVSWHDCQAFVEKLNQKLSTQLIGGRFALPTEAQWEFAARGGNKSKQYKFAGRKKLGDVAWYGRNSGSQTHIVKGKKPNELGLYDMSGNIWEWCQDWFDCNYYSSSPSTNPIGPSDGSTRVLRGGSWGSDAWLCRVSYRSSNNLDNRFINDGLRLVFLP